MSTYQEHVVPEKYEAVSIVEANIIIKKVADKRSVFTGIIHNIGANERFKDGLPTLLLLRCVWYSIEIKICSCMFGMPS